MMYAVPMSSHTCKEGFVVGTLWPCGCRHQTRLVFFSFVSPSSCGLWRDGGINLK